MSPIPHRMYPGTRALTVSRAMTVQLAARAMQLGERVTTA